MKTLKECIEQAETKEEAVYMYIREREEETDIIKDLKKEMKSMKKTPEERKEIAHKIIKIILEILLQIITMGLPMLTKGKTILKIK